MKFRIISSRDFYLTDETPDGKPVVTIDGKAHGVNDVYVSKPLYFETPVNWVRELHAGKPSVLELLMQWKKGTRIRGEWWEPLTPEALVLVNRMISTDDEKADAGRLAPVREMARKTEPGEVIAEIARLFPDLEEAPDDLFRPWQPQKFDAWAICQEDGGTKGAARFVLSLWSGSREAPWEIGPFSIVDVREMTPEGRAIIAEWLEKPFWL